MKKDKNAMDMVTRIKREERAVATLCLLEGPLNGSGNDHMLTRILAEWALAGSRSELQAQFEAMETQGLLTLTKNEAVTIIVITTKGRELVRGQVQCEGIPRIDGDCPYKIT